MDRVYIPTNDKPVDGANIDIIDTRPIWKDTVLNLPNIN